MKLSTVLAGASALLSNVVLASEDGPNYVVKSVIEARIEVRVDEFGFTVHNYQPIVAAADPTNNGHELMKRQCPRNNCLRALASRTAQATAFCATYTTAVSAGVGPFTQCDNSQKLSQACSCQVAAATTTSSTTSTTAPPSCLPAGSPCNGLNTDTTCCGGCNANTNLANGICAVETTT